VQGSPEAIELGGHEDPTYHLAREAAISDSIRGLEPRLGHLSPRATESLAVSESRFAESRFSIANRKRRS